MRQESMKKKKQISLRSGLVTTVLLCWMLPMIFMLMMGVILLGRCYRKSARESVDADATLVMQQIQMDSDILRFRFFATRCVPAWYWPSPEH